MSQVDISVLENEKIPESAKVAYLEQIASKRTDTKPSRLSTPVLVAIIGIVSAATTGLFNVWLSQQEAKNSVQTKRSDAEINAEAEERRFQFKIVEAELASKKTSAERAQVLLFLVKAGVLNSLNEDKLELMAKEALSEESKNSKEIPSLTPVNKLLNDNGEFNLFSKLGIIEKGLLSVEKFISPENPYIAELDAAAPELNLFAKAKTAMQRYEEEKQKAQKDSSRIFNGEREMGKFILSLIDAHKFLLQEITIVIAAKRENLSQELLDKWEQVYGDWGRVAELQLDILRAADNKWVIRKDK